MSCFRCGKEILSEEQFCSNCGALVLREDLNSIDFIAVGIDERGKIIPEAGRKVFVQPEDALRLEDVQGGNNDQTIQDHKQAIRQAMTGSGLAFILANEKNLSTGLSLMVAQIAHDLGIFTIAIAPSYIETAPSVHGIDALRKDVDILITVPDQSKSVLLGDRQVASGKAVDDANSATLMVVQGIIDRLNPKAYIGLNLHDIAAILKDSKDAIYGCGTAAETSQVVQAAQAAVESLQLGESISNVRGVLVEISGSYDLGMQETQAAVETVVHAVHPKAQIIWGLNLNDSFSDDVQVSLAATTPVSGESEGE
jgi:cell division protein FtsZ